MKTTYHLICVVWLIASAAANAQFLPEEAVTTDTARNYETSRNPNHSMVVGPDGTVHLVFWDGVLDASPVHPSTVWYARRDRATGRWAPLEAVDDSFTSQGGRVGGRHPSLILRPNGEVRVFWHDYRHCASNQKWMNNTEIYMDTRPPAGSFSVNDVRLTSTTAAHDGDNSYVPQVIAAPTGEILLAWYDYHFNRNLADVYCTKSNTLGVFSAPISLGPARLTDVAQRGNTVSYTLPNVALDASRTLHLVWTRDNLGGYGVYYARLPWGGSVSTPVALSTTGGDFFDPPHITASPAGDVFAAWTEHGVAPGVVVARLRPGATAFDPPVRISAAAPLQKHADLKADSHGMLHLAWADARNGPYEIFYGIFDPATATLSSQTKISMGDTEAKQPCIALSATGRVSIAWMDYRSGMGQIIFRTNIQPAAVENTWLLYR